MHMLTPIGGLRQCFNGSPTYTAVLSTQDEAVDKESLSTMRALFTCLLNHSRYVRSMRCCHSVAAAGCYQVGLTTAKFDNPVESIYSFPLVR